MCTFVSHLSEIAHKNTQPSDVQVGRSNNTNKRCCKNSFGEQLMNLRMFGELQRYWKGRNLKALRGSIISRLPEKFVEKYNVCDLDLEAGGGEYPVQDGFGWSNGVYLAMRKLLADQNP